MARSVRRGLDRLGGRRARTRRAPGRRSCAPRWSGGPTSWKPVATPPARDRGLLRTEGRDYVVADGDVITIKV